MSDLRADDKSDANADATALAKASAQSMWQTDNASRGLGMQLESVHAGRAVLTMVVQSSMINGHTSGHGGFTFTLADSAFAFACNSYDYQAVAHQASITYIAPVREGDTLRATATEVTRYGRSGIYDVRVTNQDDVLVAEFRGHSRAIRAARTTNDVE